MTRASVEEYAAALRERYRQSEKGAKGRILDEFCQTTGYHRESAIRLLGHTPHPTGTRRGRPRTYGRALQQVVEHAWEVDDRPCAQRLQPFLPTLVEALERHGELTVPAAVRPQLTQVSVATVERLLRSRRQRERQRPLHQGRAVSAIQAQIPVRTWSEWEAVAPGAVQADLVLHGGENPSGFFLTTLDGVDVGTGWTACQAVWGKTQQHVRSALAQVCLAFPFPVQALHTDNGSEFLNAALYDYCQQHHIASTRGRPWRKNDQAYVEQRNWSVVRKTVGYQRFDSRAAYGQLARLYRALTDYVNFFQPLRKLVSKERVGGKVRKRFDRAQTPYQRVLASGVLDETARVALEARYQRLNPVQVRAEIVAAQEALWRLATRVQQGVCPRPREENRQGARPRGCRRCNEGAVEGDHHQLSF